PPTYISPLSLHDALPILRIVAWSGDSAVTFRARAVVAALVASRSNDDNARAPCSLNCLTKRINRVALVDLAAKRKVDHSNVVRRDRKSTRLNSSHVAISY